MQTPIPWWRDRRVVPLLVQALVGLLLLVLVAFLLSNLVRNLTAAGLLLSWRWLAQPAGFELSQSLLPFAASMPFGRALLAGLLNSLQVILLALAGSSLLGLLLGLSAFSSNALLRGLARLYVELIRNIPLLLQLLFWYFVVFLGLLDREAALQLPGLVLARSGLHLAWFGAEGWQAPRLLAAGWQAPLSLSVEFSALLTGLVTYFAAFIAEVVRGGIASVPHGQWEAAASLGLGRLATLRHIVLPQALRVIVPALTNQYIGLAKASSLALACGFSDLYAVAETTLNQTGRAVEVFVLLLAAYLGIDLLISLLMNGLNQLVQLRER